MRPWRSSLPLLVAVGISASANFTVFLKGAALGILFCLAPWVVAQQRPDAVPTPPARPAVPYQDKVIERTFDAVDGVPVDNYDSSGLLRAWSLETFVDQRQISGQSTQSIGLKANGYTDTLHYGTLSANASLLKRDVAQDSDASFTLRQIGMPFDGGWRLDNALGLINLPVLDLARSSQRITLTTPAMQGLHTQVRQGGLSLLAAAGRAGQVQGYPASGFSVSQGTLAMAGLQNQRLLDDGVWQWGAKVAQAQDVTSVLAQTALGQGRMDAQGAYLGLRRDWASANLGNETYAQVNVVSGRNTGTDAGGIANVPAGGLWLEGAVGLGTHRLSWGLFRLETGLAWLDLPMANDLQGAYGRHAWRTRQWSVESGIEVLRSISGTTADGYFANGTARYQFSTTTSFGATASVRRYGIQAQAIQLYSQFSNELGATRAQFEWGSSDNGERLVRLQLDHDWTQVQNMRLSTAASMDRQFRPTGDSAGLGGALNVDWSIGQNVALSQSLQGRWSSDQTQYTLNAGLNWRLAPQWSLQTNVYAIQGQSNAASIAASPLTAPTVTTTNNNDSGIFALLRYDESAGRARAPVGGRPGAAAGRLAGSVFLDDNQNGKREAGEQGAVNVTVLLNGRFAVQTDAQGRFEFPYVAAGAHVLTVISDNLPLPWGLVKDGRTEVRVFTRDSVSVDIGAVRQ